MASVAELPVAQDVNTQGNAAGPPRPGMDYKSMLKSFMFRIVLIYVVSTFFKKRDSNISQTNNNSTMCPTCKSQNMLSLGTPLDLYVYLSENGVSHSFDENNVFWFVENIEYGDWHSGPSHDGFYEISKQIKTSKNLQNNGSLFAYIYFVKNGNSPNPFESNFDPLYTFHAKKRLNKFKKKVYQKTHNLLTGVTQDLEGKKKVESGTKSEILSHWHPNLTINILVDNTSWVKGQIPHPISEFVVFDQFDPCHYQPVVYLNDFWNFASDYMPINDTTEYLNLTLTFAPISLFKWQLYVSQNVKNKWVTLLTEGVLKDSSSSTAGGINKDGGVPVEEDEDSQDENKDSFKKALLGTNPYLLGATILISIVHSVFEILAFKNDIQFWKSRQTLEGLSIRTIFYNIASSVIVLLYVMDNDTNFMVRITIFIGMLIEFWKITKCVDIKLDRSAPKMLGGLLPRITFKHKPTYVESNTREYDMMAYKYLSWVLFPLLVAYAGYAVIYQEHKGWYSFILSMLYGFLLTFGFIMMTPQLFINYKLKSVAHLPWRMMTYKALNTFIDDIFAFVIHMPTLYRIGCFRDDIIFFIYLYQRWIYKTDMKRVNEFGTSGELLANQSNSTTDPDAIEDSKPVSPLAILPSAQESQPDQVDSQAATPNSENENGSSCASSEVGNGSETTSSFVKLNNSPEDVSGLEDELPDEEGISHSFASTPAQPSQVAPSPNTLVKRKNVRKED